MKKNLLLPILVLAAVPFNLKAQNTNNGTKSNVSLVVKVNNLYQFTKKPLNNFYSVGSDIGVYFNNIFYLGLGQYRSIAPSDLWKNNPYDPDKIRVNEYSLLTGYKVNLIAPAYLFFGARGGYSALQMERLQKNGLLSDGPWVKQRLGGAFVTPEVKLGVRVQRYISLEAGLNYRYNLGDQKKWGLSKDRLNGLGGVVSIVGNIPL